MWTSGPEEEYFKGFSIYEYVGHLGHVTRTIYINVRPLLMEGSHEKLRLICQVV